MFWELWREEKFFECHEVLEELWKRTETIEKWFYSGLINAAVAIYQHRRGNVYGACRQLLRAQVKLHPFAPRHRGVDIETLLRSIEDEIASSLAQLSTSQRAQQPALRQSIQQRMARDFQNTSALDDRENDTHGR
jgi:predicted metal-dependent hydrolase